MCIFGQNAFTLEQAAQNCPFRSKYLYFSKKLLKTVVLAKNSFVLAKAAQIYHFFLAKMAFLWQKLLSLVWQKYADKMSQNGKLVQKDQDGKPVQKNQNGKFVPIRKIDELE